jgi:hypothetical protein
VPVLVLVHMCWFPVPSVDCQMLGRLHVGVGRCCLDVVALKP